MYLRREQSNEHQTPNKYLAFPNLHQLKFKPGQSNHVGQVTVSKDLKLPTTGVFQPKPWYHI